MPKLVLKLKDLQSGQGEVKELGIFTFAHDAVPFAEVNGLMAAAVTRRA